MAKRWWGVVFVWAVVAVGCASPPPADTTPPVSVLVGIEHRRGRQCYLGAGTVIGGNDDETYVLTAGHVVSGPGVTRAFLVTDGPEPPSWIDARVVACECTLAVGDVVAGRTDYEGLGDYAILALQGRPVRSTALSLAAPAWQSMAHVETFEIDDGLFSSSSPGARTSVPLRLRPLDAGNPFVLGVPVDGEIRQGMSGSPVLSDGRLVAMLVAVAESSRRANRYAVLVGAPAIAGFLERCGLTELVSRAQPSVAPRVRSQAAWPPAAPIGLVSEPDLIAALAAR